MNKSIEVNIDNDRINEKLDEFATYEKGWGGNQEEPFSKEVLDKVLPLKNYLRDLFGCSDSDIDVFPGQCGDIDLSILSKVFAMEVTITKEGKMNYVFERTSDGGMMDLIAFKNEARALLKITEYSGYESDTLDTPPVFHYGDTFSTFVQESERWRCVNYSNITHSQIDQDVAIKLKEAAELNLLSE